MSEAPGIYEIRDGGLKFMSEGQASVTFLPGKGEVIMSVYDKVSVVGTKIRLTKDQAEQVGRALLRLAGVDEGRVKLPAVELSDE